MPTLLAPWFVQKGQCQGVTGRSVNLRYLKDTQLIHGDFRVQGLLNLSNLIQRSHVADRDVCSIYGNRKCSTAFVRTRHLTVT